MSISVKDISRVTKLSLGTISNYLNGKTIKEANRIAIEEAINNLGYRINLFGRNLKTNRSQTIGVILPFLDDTFSAKIISLIEDTLRRENYAVIICDTRQDASIEKNIIDFFIERMVDGVILFPDTNQGSIYNGFIERNIPLVAVDRTVKGMEIDTIAVNNFKMSYEATKRIISYGHKRIGVLCGPVGIYSADERLNGYKSALRDSGIEINDCYIKHAAYTKEAAATEVALDLLNERDKVTAIFATNYYFTMGVVIACNEKNLVVGKDISLFGFDNLTVNKLIRPKLTLVEQPLKEIARFTAELLLSKINKTNHQPIGLHIFDGTIIEGESLLKI